ncbi:hypothetical protein Efla_004858 [Eimeria flavescens]
MLRVAQGLVGMQGAFPPLRLTDAVQKAISCELGLPALRIGAQLLETIRANLVTVVTGSTGCGKTTIVPLLLLLQHANARLLIALPRRIAVQMASDRLRQLLGEESLGNVVGYHIGHEDACKSDDTRLLFVTAGMLRKYVTGALRKLHVLGQQDTGSRSDSRSIGTCSGDRLRWIFPYDFVLVDEVHERSVDCDMALLLLKCLAVKMTAAAASGVRLPLFRIVVMSATISSSDFATFLAGESLNVFEAEHAAWIDQTRLFRLRGELLETQLMPAVLDSSASNTEFPSEVECQQIEARKCDSLLCWARSLSVCFNELALLWKSRRSRALLRVLRDQHSSMATKRLSRSQWKRVSDTSLVRGNCLEVARRTNFPVEELFWEDLRDLATASLTASASQLLEVASPTLSRFMGLESVEEALPPSQGPCAGEHNAADESKILGELSVACRNCPTARWEEDSSTWPDDGFQDLNRGEYSLGNPKLRPQDIVDAARLLVLIHIQSLRRNAPQRGVLVFLPGKPEISRMARALADAKREAVNSMRFSCGSASSAAGTNAEAANSVQLAMDMIVLEVHRDAETQDLKLAKQRMQSPTCMKIILATNIAESSITFVDVSIVLDFALVKEKHVHSVTNAHRLQLRWASRAALQQRKGRAGRVGEGIYMCLITRELYDSLSELPLPELQRLPLEDVLMDTMAALPGESSDASLFIISQAQDPPDVTRAYEALCDMEAMGALELRSLSSPFTHLTPLGHLACSLALPVKVTRLLLLGAAFGIMPGAIWAAALLTSERPRIYECQPHGVKSQVPLDVDVLRWVATRSARLAAAACSGEPLFPQAFDAVQKLRFQKDEFKGISGENACGQGSYPIRGSFLWGEFIPCDICIDVLTMLRLQNQFGDNLRHLQNFLQMQPARRYPGQQAQRGRGRFQYASPGMRQLTRHLAANGISVHAVADVVSEYYAISRRLSRAGFFRCAGASRSMGLRFSDLKVPGDPSGGWNIHNGIEGFVWRLQLVLASAYMPFGFSNTKDSFMQSPFNLGQQPQTHFAYDVLCYDGFRERPDLRCREALVESWRQKLPKSVYAPWELPLERPRSGCVCSYRFFEGCSEVPALHQGHLESSSVSNLAANTELNEERFSQLQFASELQLALQNGCNLTFRLRLAAALLCETDPKCFNHTLSHDWSKACSTANHVCRTADWIAASRALDVFITKVVLNLAEARPTRLLAQALCTTLVRKPEYLHQLCCEQQGNWSLVQPQVGIHQIRQELTAALMQPALVGRIASCLSPLRFFSLTVKKQIPLADLLLCEGWDFNFQSDSVWDDNGPLKRVEELLTPLLSRGSRTLLPTDLRGVAEAVRVFFSTKQLNARRQQARRDSKRAKGQGRVRFKQEQDASHLDTASLWAPLVEEHAGSLKSVAGLMAEDRSTVSKLLREAAETTQPKFERSQLLIFGNCRRRALVQWLHRAANAVNMGGSGKKQGRLTGIEIEFVKQPPWASMLPLGLKESELRPSKNGDDEGGRFPVRKSRCPTDVQFEEMMLEAAETAQRIAGGGAASKGQILDLVPQATRVVRKLIDLHQADFKRVEQYRMASEEGMESRRPFSRSGATNASAEQFNTGQDDRLWRGSKSLKAPPHLDESAPMAVKGSALPQHVKKEDEVFSHRAASWSPNEASDRMHQDGRVHCDQQGHGDFAGRNWAASGRSESNSYSERPFFSVSHQFLKQFLAIDAEARCGSRLRGLPNTSRICHLAEQSILLSSGPFYPNSSTREFLLLSLNEWDLSDGLGIGGSAVGAASLLPPLPHLEELLLFLLAPASVVFMADHCLCYCCKACSCNPRNGLQGPQASQAGGLDPRGSSSSRAEHVTSRGMAVTDCCSSCLRGAVCYACVSFGGFRDFGFVPRFLWKQTDIALLNEARSALREVLRPTDGKVEWGLLGLPHESRSNAKTGGQTQFDVDEEGASDDDEERQVDQRSGKRAAKQIKGLSSAVHSRTATSGLCLEFVLEQLVLPKIQLQRHQRLAATAASAKLRSQSEQQASSAHQRSSDRSAPECGNAICWKYLNLARQRQTHKHPSTAESAQNSPSSIAVYVMKGAPFAEPARACESDYLKRTFIADCGNQASSALFVRLQQIRAGLHTTAGSSQAPIEISMSGQHADSLANAVASSLRCMQAPKVPKTALLPEGARPSLWGLPASVLLQARAPQRPSLATLQKLDDWRGATSQARQKWVEDMAIQCAHSCCRVPLAFVGDLQRIIADRLPCDGNSWASIGLKYLFEELHGYGGTKGEEKDCVSRRFLREEVTQGRTKPTCEGGSCSSSPLQQTLIDWMVDSELVDSSLKAKVSGVVGAQRRQELWVLDSEKALQKWRMECSICSKEDKASGSHLRSCDNWPCVVRKHYPHKRVHLLDDEKATFARLKLEHHLLLTPSSVAFVCAYIRPLQRTRHRLQCLLKTKQEETFKPEANPGIIAQHNRIKQQHSHIVDKFLGWILCGGPVSHIVGFHVFQYVVFPSDSLVDVAGHTDAQRVHFWRLASSNVVPRGPDDFPVHSGGAPLLSFKEALSLNERARCQEGTRRGSRTDGQRDAFWAAAKYIHEYEQGVCPEDLTKSSQFVEHMIGLIRRRCSHKAENVDINEISRHQKYVLESWDPSGTSVSEAGSAASQEHPLGAHDTNVPQMRDLSTTMRDILTQSSHNLKESIMPADLFDWQQHLLEQQRFTLHKELCNAHKILPAEWVGDTQARNRRMEEISITWRWTPDQEDRERQWQTDQEEQKRREAEAAKRMLEQAEAERKILAEKAAEAWRNSHSSFSDF